MKISNTVSQYILLILGILAWHCKRQLRCCEHGIFCAGKLLPSAPGFRRNKTKWRWRISRTPCGWLKKRRGERCEHHSEDGNQTTPYSYAWSWSMNWESLFKINTARFSWRFLWNLTKIHLFFGVNQGMYLQEVGGRPAWKHAWPGYLGAGSKVAGPACRSWGRSGLFQTLGMPIFPPFAQIWGFS